MPFPIDLVPNTTPPCFRWRQRIETIAGTRLIDCEGTLPPSVEGAIVELVALAKRQAQEIADLTARLTIEPDTSEPSAPPVAPLTPSPPSAPPAIPLKRTKGLR